MTGSSGDQLGAKLGQGSISASIRLRMLGSMGQVGSGGGNAGIKSFFTLLQKNILNRQARDVRNELRIAIVTRVGTNAPPTDAKPRGAD